MSRAFTKEDDFADDLPDRPISSHPNQVTERDLQIIEQALNALTVKRKQPAIVKRLQGPP